MGRKIFDEKGYNVSGRVLTYGEFKLCHDLPDGFKINEGFYPEIIAKAEKQQTAEIPQLLASDFMRFKRDGNRSVHEEKYAPRRKMVLELALAEYVEGKGRFLDKLIDVLWLLLEETTWALPAHIPNKSGVVTCLPYAYEGHVDHIDLFSAATAATLSFVYHLCKDKFDSVTTVINERILFEINRRIVEPFMNDADLWERNWWCGIRGNEVCNWCPWIVSNVLTVCALTVKNQATRTMLVQRAISMLDSFTSVYREDGGCDEGPGYWSVAGGALYTAGLALYDLTGGYVNIFDDPLVKSMGEYAVKVVVTDRHVLNFADSTCRTMPIVPVVYGWGMRCGSEMMVTFARSKMGGKLPFMTTEYNIPYRFFCHLCMDTPAFSEYKAPTKFYLKDLVVAGARESSDTKKGLYVALKGGHNAESHNHNDLGNVIVFADGNPMFVDAGSGIYTKRTFSAERYTIWSTASDYHNCAIFNGIPQKEGRNYYSSTVAYDETTGKLTLDLTAAYPIESDIEKYTRSAVLENGVVTVEDDVTLKNEGTVAFTFLVTQVPESVTENCFTLCGRTVTFDSSLEYNLEELTCDWQEVSNIPSNWETDVMRRIVLTSKDRTKGKRYIITVS